MEIKIIYIEYEKKYSNLFERSSSFKNILNLFLGNSFIKIFICWTKQL